MTVITILILSISFQLAVFVAALRLIRFTGIRLAWIIVSIAMLLMALRRSLSLYHLIFDAATFTPDLGAEIIALITSIFLVLGILLIKPFFNSLQNSEEATRQNEERYRRLIRISPMAVCVQSDGILRFMNPAAAKLLKVPDDQKVVNQPILNWIHPDYRQAAHKWLYTSGPDIQEAVFQEAKWLCSDGTELEVELAAIPFIHQNSSYVQLVLKDITERNKSEKERETFLRLSQRLTQSINMKEMARIIAQECRPLFNHDAFLLQLLDEPRQMLTGIYCEDTPLGDNTPREAVITDTPLSMFQTSPLWSGEPVLINRMNEPAHTALRPFGEEDRLSRSLMFAPIFHEKKKIGVLSVQSYTPGLYQEKDLQLLQAVASLCAGAVVRVRAGETLQKDEERYRTFIEHSAEGISRYETREPVPIDLPIEEQIERFYSTAYLAECNEALAIMYGYSHAAEMRKVTLDKIFDRQNPNIQNLIRLFIQNGYRLINIETHDTNVQGNDVYFLNSFIGFVENGCLCRAWGIQRDITRQKKDELALNEQNERLSLLNAIARITIGSSSPEDLCERLLNILTQTFPCDAFFIDQYDLEKDECTNILNYDTLDGRLQIVPPVSISMHTQASFYQAVIQDRQSYLLHRSETDPVPSLTNFGDTTRLSASLLFVPLISGDRVVGVLSIQSYTPNAYTPRHRELLEAVARLVGPALEATLLSKQLLSSEERLRMIIESVPTILTSTSTSDATGYFITPSVERITGYPIQKFLERPSFWFEIVHPEDLDQVVRNYQNSRTQKKALDHEYRILTRNGQICWLLERITPVLDEQGNILRFDGIAEDITERKQAEEAIIRSEEIYRKAIENASGVPYHLRYEDGKYDFIGAGFEALVGYPAESFAFKDFQKIVQEIIVTEPNAPQDAYEYGRQFRQGKYPQYRADFRIITPTGEEKWLSDCSVPIHDKTTGKIIGSLGILQDITERKKTEQELRQSQARYASLFNNAMVGLYRTRITDGKVLECNDRFARMFGYESRQQCLDMMYSKPHYVDENRRKILLNLLQQQDQAEDYEAQFFRSDGSLFWGRYSARINREEDYVEGIMTDITEEKTAEEARTQLAIVIEQAAESVMITDTGGNILYVNPAFERYSGYSRNEVIGKNPRILKSGKHDEQFYKDLWDTLLRGEVWTGRLTNRRKDGTFYEVEGTISSIRDSSGKIVNFVAARRDVTKEVALEHQLRHAQKMEAIGQLAAGIAHDFNNLLTGILGNIGLIEMGNPEETPALLGEAKKAAFRAAELVSQLLTFSRRRLMQPKYLDLNDLIANLLKMLQRFIRENIQLDFIPGQNIGTIHADPGQIEQVLINLCVNARDAMPEGGRLAIETESVNVNASFCQSHPWAKPGDYVLLRISDNGQGMDSHTLNHVFEPFFTTKEVGKGTGLGLAAVYGIVKQHGGMIHVYSEINKGTTFKIYLPIISRSIESSIITEQPPIRPGKETILLAEDEEMIRSLVKRILESYGYTVLLAEDGREALRIFKEDPTLIDLVLLDVVMPRLGGYGAYLRMREIRPDLKVIFSSGHMAGARKSDVSEIEGLPMIPKPYNPEDLARTVRDVLDGVQ